MWKTTCPNCRATLTPPDHPSKQQTCWNCPWPMIQFVCAKCGAKFQVAPENAGKRGKCAKCGTVVVIPTPLSEEVTPSDRLAFRREDRESPAGRPSPLRSASRGFAFSRGDRESPEVNPPVFDYMQLLLYNSEKDGLNAINHVLPKLDKVTVPFHIELRRAKRKGVFPIWIVLYFRRDADYDAFSKVMGDGDIGKALDLYGNRDYDYGHGQPKYRSIRSESELLGTVKPADTFARQTPKRAGDVESTARQLTGTCQLVLVCGHVGTVSPAYEQAESVLLKRIVADHGANLANARVRTMRGASLPDSGSEAGVDGFVRMLQMTQGTGLRAYQTEFRTQDGFSFMVVYIS